MPVLDSSFLGCFIATQDSGGSSHLPGFGGNEIEEVIHAVSALLNTRSPFSLSVCSQLTRRTVLDYGLPDFLHLSPLSREASYQLARAVREAIDAHEKRLIVDTIDVQLPRPSREIFRVVVTGSIRTRRGDLERVSFPIEVQ